MGYFTSPLLTAVCKRGEEGSCACHTQLPSGAYFKATPKKATVAASTATAKLKGILKEGEARRGGGVLGQIWLHLFLPSPFAGKMFGEEGGEEKDREERERAGFSKTFLLLLSSLNVTRPEQLCRSFVSRA